MNNCFKCFAVSGDNKIVSVLDPELYPDISFMTSKINRNDKSCPEIRYFLFMLNLTFEQCISCLPCT